MIKNIKLSPPLICVSPSVSPLSEQLTATFFIPRQLSMNRKEIKKEERKQSSEAGLGDKEWETQRQE